MKIEFIKHSCYTIETENYYLVFDYIGGALNINKEKKVIFFVSHRHSDHFQEMIFDFKADYYIISDDVKIKEDHNIILIGPDSNKNICGLEIKTHGSTDEGVSFYVKADGKGIIHSGDLNYWIWDEYTKEDIANMDKWFKGEVDKFIPYDTYLVMLPVDPRLKDNYYLTAEYFLENINAKHFFPMHMWEKYEISEKLKNKLQGKYPNKEIHLIKGDNQLFNL